MPFYLICDVSYSMTNDMAALNDGVQRLRQSIVAEPVVDDVVAHRRHHVLRHGQAHHAAEPDERTGHADAERGGVAPNYGRGIPRARQHYPQADAAALKAQGYRVFRPCAFFLTDGEPNDADYWETFKSTLAYNGVTGVGMKQYPVFIPFGFRDAPEDVLRKLAWPPEKRRWYHIKSHDIGQVIKLILDVIMKTVVSSGNSSSTGKPALVHAPVPAVAGVTQGDAEDFIA